MTVNRASLRWQRVRHVAFRLRVPVAVLVLYVLFRAVFTYATEGGGLLSPGAPPAFGLLALGLVTMALRLVAIVLLPGMLAYEAVIAAFRCRTPRPPAGIYLDDGTRAAPPSARGGGRSKRAPTREAQ